jgi:transposase
VITIEMVGKIRRMYFRDKMSLHEITKRTSLSRNTVRKWLRSTDEVAQPTYRREQMPCKLTPFHEALKQALKADSLRHKQNRRTGPRCRYRPRWPPRLSRRPARV